MAAVAAKKMPAAMAGWVCALRRIVRTAMLTAFSAALVAGLAATLTIWLLVKLNAKGTFIAI